MKNFLFPLVLLMFFSACNRNAYLSPAIQYMRGGEGRLAILPFEVTNWVQKIPKGATLESLKEAEKKDAYVMQRDLFRYCIREMSRQENIVEIQHINYTNDLLKAKGITYEDLKGVPREELAKILEVDAIISSKVSQIITNRSGFMIRRVMNGVWGSRNQVEATFVIHQKSDGKMLWKYDYGLSIAGEDSVDEVSKAILRSVSKVVIEVNR
ncbi:MAG: hypothetical protein ACI8YQ_005271 [Polaribacter sp.]|jgi:hypothetical protein